MSLLVDIRKNFGRFQLNVSFEASGGDITGLLGASSCGKSVTLKCVAGIETPDEEKIVLDGRVLFDSDKRVNLSPQKRKVGYLFQNYALFPNMTVAQNIAAGVRGQKSTQREAIVRRMVRSLHLEGAEGKYSRQLSGCKNISRARALPDGRVEAVDWGVELACAAPLSDSLAYIGVRAHYLHPTDGPGPNRVPCRVERVAQEVFSTVVVLSTPGGGQGYSLLRIELPKAEWPALDSPD